MQSRQIVLLIIMLGISLKMYSSDFDWQKDTPESEGFSSVKLETMKNRLIEKNTKKLLIIKNDKIIFEWFAKGWEDSEKNHYSASLAKALVGGMSLAIALNDGKIYPDMPAFPQNG
jgi:hypothetical protein